MTTVSGILRDAKGMALPGVAVTLRYVPAVIGYSGGAVAQNNLTYLTSSTGLLTMPGLVAGPYDLSIAMPIGTSAAVTAAVTARLVVNGEAAQTLEDALQTTIGEVTPTILSLAIAAADRAEAAAAAAALFDPNNFQPKDATLTSIAALGTAPGKIAYTTGVDTWAEAVITAAGRALLDDADAAAQRATLGLGTVTTMAEAVTDLDTITASGWSRFAPGTANAPMADNSGYVLTITSGSVGVQMVWGHLGGADNTFAWIRWRGSSGWMPWVRLYGSQSEILGLVGAGQSGTVATTSGSVIDFVSIPSGVNRVTLSMQRVSLSGSSFHKIQLGAGAVQSVGYDTISGVVGYYSTATDSFIMRAFSAARALTGAITFNHIGGNIWVGSGVLQTNEPGTQIVAGQVALTGPLDRIRLRSANETDTFDEGSINISWER